jgi:hypothetical protein
LGIQRVEGLFETFFGGFSGVDRAANRRFAPVLMSEPDPVGFASGRRTADPTSEFL